MRFAMRLDEDTEIFLLELLHAERLFALIDENRAHLSPWFPWVATTRSLKDTEDFIRRGLEQFARSDGFQAGILYKGELAGVVGLHYLNLQVGRTEIGYWLGKSYEGKGIVTRTCSFLCRYFFAGLGLNRVEIRCAPRNARSRAVPERLGFQQEGILRQVARSTSGYEDHVVYSMLRSEWAKEEKR